MEKIQHKIQAEARKWLGVREIPGNKGWRNKTFHTLMVSVGWLNGQAWCAYFAELVWLQAYTSRELRATHTRLFSGSVMATWNNFRKAGYAISQVPTVGALAVWQSTNNAVLGHIGVVTEVVTETEFKSVEGNTAESGTREGCCVAEKTNFTNKLRGSLKFLGFIYPVAE